MTQHHPSRWDLRSLERFPTLLTQDLLVLDQTHARVQGCEFRAKR